MARGGKRKGAGRPKGTGKFGEPTKAVRLPISKIDDIMNFIECDALTLPVYSTKAQAGYPAPDDNVPAEKVNLTDRLMENPKAMFLARMDDSAMEKIGIFPDDLLLADKSVEPQDGHVVVAVLDGKFIIRRLVVKNGKIELKSENPKFPTIKIKDAAKFNIWGVVRRVIHTV